MEIKDVCVIGGGTMGSGIAHVFALSGLRVTLVEARQELLERAVAEIARNLERQAAKKAITPEDRKAALGRLKPSLKLEEARGAGLVVEAVPESMPLKTEVFRRLDAACGPEAILATNTSSLSVTEIAAATGRPGKVVGMHFMNPVPVMKLVEIVRGKLTSEETVRAVRDVAVALGKIPVLSKDAPGFIANRVLMPMINEAAFALMEGVASKEDIDAVMKLGMNHPMGPLALADFIGLDVCLAVMETLHAGFGGSKYRPCPLLGKMVESGRLGRKTGRGFYDYEAVKA